jgi:hypothetical protein
MGFYEVVLPLGSKNCAMNRPSLAYVRSSSTDVRRRFRDLVAVPCVVVSVFRGVIVAVSTRRQKNLVIGSWLLSITRFCRHFGRISSTPASANARAARISRNQFSK